MRKKILIVADVPGWAFHNHAEELKARLSDEFDFETVYTWLRPKIDPNLYDLVYLMDRSTFYEGPVKEKSVCGCRAEFPYKWEGTPSFKTRVESQVKAIHAVSLNIFKDLSAMELSIPIEYITHGVNIQKFDSIMEETEGDLIVGWSGSEGSGGNKGFKKLILPLEGITGVKVVSVQQSFKKDGPTKNHTPHEKMGDFYKGIHVYVCASESEGNNNGLLEAGACGRALISTKTGTAPEYIIHGSNGFLVERDFDSIKEAIIKLRDDRSLLKEFGDKVREVIRNEWTWDRKAEEYRAWFRKWI